MQKRVSINSISYNMTSLFNPSELHGKVINYDKMKKLPIRNAFLDPVEHASISDDITKGSPLLFMPNDLHEMNLQDKKYGKAKYKIILFGVLMDGRRASVVISGIQPYVDVLIPKPVKSEDAEYDSDEETESSLAQGLFEKLKSREYAKPTKFEIVKGKRFKIHQKERGVYARFYFTKLKTRKEAIKYVKDKGYETASDDSSCYYRVVCRDNLTTFSSWLDISEYVVKTYTSIRGTVFDVTMKHISPCTKDITKFPKLSKDNLMTCCWDIETYSPDGELPRPNNPLHKMFMIGITFQWHHANTQLLRVCLVEHKCDARPNYLTIVCGSEKKIIKAFGKLVFKMKPEIFLGFNDSDYDWPWLINRAHEYKGTLAFLAGCFDSTVYWKNYDDDAVLKYNFKKEKVKLEADAYADGFTLKYPGYINIDVRTVFRQLYPTAEKSNLNFYLALNKLSGKKDMPYKEIFATYAEITDIAQNPPIGNAKYSDQMNSLRKNLGPLLAAWEFKVTGDQTTRMTPDIIKIIKQYTIQTRKSDLEHRMAEVADYCVIDSQRCHELMKIRSVIMDRRAASNLTYVSVFDAFYRANGMKVRNLVIAEGQQRGLKFSNITNSGEVEEGKYPGAYVFPPKKGLVTSKMTIEERVSLANSNEKYSPWSEIAEKQIGEFKETIMKHGAYVTDDVIDIIIKERVDTESPNYPKCFLDFLQESIGRPVTGLDFSSLYPSLIMTYNLSPEYIIIDKRKAQQASAEGHNLHKIKFPYNGRTIRGWCIRHDNKLDADSPDCKFGVYPLILKKLFDTRKLMKKDLHIWEAKKEIMDTLTPDEFDKRKDEYDNVCFNFNYYDAKQKALKLIMNTFYGESGNKRSPFFVLQLAGAITTAGQVNIKMVQKHVEEEGCNVYYGDSVTGDTPLVVRNRDTKIVKIKSINMLSKKWKSYDQFKPGEPDRINKQQARCPLQIWTEGDWHDIRKVIRHKTNKKMFRVNTHTGCIDVTEDHSLMRPNRTKINPGELEIGTELMHSFPAEFPEIKYSDKLSIDEAWVWGCFAATGIYGIKNNTIGEYVLQFRSINHEVVKKLELCLKICEPHIEFKCVTIYHDDNSCDDNYYKKTSDDSLYTLTTTKNSISLINKYRKLFRASGKYKSIPTRILNGSLEIRQSFYNGYTLNNKRVINIKCLTKLIAQGIYYLAVSLTYEIVDITMCHDNTYYIKLDANIYEFGRYGKKYKRKKQNPIAVKKILELPEVTQDEFVYDIETSKGSFLGGVGALNVKNTDSIYSSMPEESFMDLDKAYYAGMLGKEEYWSKMVDMTFKVIAKINTDVNNMLKADNGTQFLKMAFEESIYPVAFLAKKKYYGIPHISIANFHPKNLFIRGLEVKKRGVSDFLKKICMDIMWDSVSMSNLNTLMELVLTKIDYIYETNWAFDDFVMTDVFKPNKQNIKVHTFAARMLQEGIVVKPHERFRYVITKKNPFRYDERGRKTALSVGDKMEYADRAAAKKMQIDMDYYMKGSINGQLSRLVVYADTFQVDPVTDSAEDIKASDDKIYANACKFIDNYCKKYYTQYHSKGKIYQSIFRMSNKAITTTLKEHYVPEVVDIFKSSYDRDNMESWMEIKAEKTVIKGIKGYGKSHVDIIMNKIETTVETDILSEFTDENDDDYISTRKEKKQLTETISAKTKTLKKAKMKDLQDMYFARKADSMLHKREKAFKERKNALQRQLKDNLEAILSVLNHHAGMVDTVSKYIKDTLGIDKLYNGAGLVVPAQFGYLDHADSVDALIIMKTAEQQINKLLEDEKLSESVNKMKIIYINMLSNYEFIHKTRSIVDHLKACRNKTIGVVIKPDSFDANSFIKDNVDKIVNGLM